MWLDMPSEFGPGYCIHDKDIMRKSFTLGQKVLLFNVFQFLPVFIPK